MIESADLPFVDVTLMPLAVAPWNDTRQLFRPKPYAFASGEINIL
jgi:hypothetical protein